MAWRLFGRTPVMSVMEAAYEWRESNHFDLLSCFWSFRLSRFLLDLYADERCSSCVVWLGELATLVYNLKFVFESCILSEFVTLFTCLSTPLHMRMRVLLWTVLSGSLCISCTKCLAAPHACLTFALQPLVALVDSRPRNRAAVANTTQDSASWLVCLFPWGVGLGWIDLNLILHKFMMELFHLNPTHSNLV
jgi:hypothetical protein